jgi:hypothetical protein
MKNLRHRANENAKAYNRHLTDEYLNKLEPLDLFRFTHPTDRMSFFEEYGKIRKKEVEDELN